MRAVFGIILCWLLVSGVASAGSFDQPPSLNQSLWARSVDKPEDWSPSASLHGLNDVRLWIDSRLAVTPPLGYRLTDRLGSFIQGTWDGAHTINPPIGSLLGTGALYSNGFDTPRASQQMGIAFGLTLRF
jgi:hypothetical protein